MASRVKLSSPVRKIGPYEYYVIGPDPTTYFLIIRGWLPKGVADQIFVYYQQLPGWEPPKYTAYGRVNADSPRLAIFESDREIAGHHYSNVFHASKEWDPVSRALRDRVVRELNIYFDAGLLNRYRNRDDSIKKHRDDEAETGENQTVVGISFGGSRRFYLTPDPDAGIPTDTEIKVEVHSGDALVMSGYDLQRRFLHSIPNQAGVSERISMTFRNLSGAYNPYHGQTPRK
jgi:alkylated DNA repair dioxygenase AlkB